MALPHTIADGTSADVAELDANFAVLDDRSRNLNCTQGAHVLVTATALDPGIGNTRVGTHIREEGGFYASMAASGSVLNRNNDGGVLSFYRGGNFVGGVAVTASGTTYGTSSDYRLKSGAVPLAGSGAFIDALQPKSWTWLTGGQGCGLIAHEVQAVSPSSVVGAKDAVDPESGAPVYQAVAYSSPEIIANLIAEVQSLRARLAAAGIA